MQYTFTMHKPSGKTRPHFDHFFKKSAFPWLSLSFYNLVPSCYVCNSNFKGQKVFSTEKYLHPFIEGFEGVLNFETGISGATYSLGGEEDFTIEIAKVKSALPKQIKKAIRNAKVFHLSFLYNNHKDYIGEIIKKTQWYNKTRLDELNNEIGDGKLFTSNEEVMRIALGNYLMPEQMGKRVLSKITRDIAKEFNFAKYIFEDI